MNRKLQNQDGVSYIEVMIAITILTIGILAQLSVLTYSMVRVKDNEHRNAARQIASSTVESIFAARDLGSMNGINNWDAVNMNNVSTEGMFVPGWHPVRKSPGEDGIHGTADDACFYNVSCSVGGYTNASEVNQDYEREITITDVNEQGIPTARKRRIEVKVRYFVGQLLREETLTTMIADLPFYN